MRQIYARIHRGGRALAAHPLFTEWLQDDTRAAQEKLLFAPMAIDYVMGFRDFCTYYVAYSAPQNVLEEALTVHAAEDASHSTLFLEDWATLGIDARFSLTPRSLYAWMNSPATARARRADYELTKLAVENPDPRFRFAIIEAMEVAGQVFFRSTVPIVDALLREHTIPKDLRYFGRHHLDREDGHLQHADESAFFATTFSDDERAHAEALVDQVFAIFTTHFDLWLQFAKTQIATGNFTLPSEPTKESTKPFYAHPLAPSPNEDPALTAAIEELREAPFAQWLSAQAAPKALRFLYLQWCVDLWAWSDFFAIDCGAPVDPSAEARGLVRLAARLATESERRSTEWALLDLDRATGWSAVEALRHYWLDPSIAEHRRLFAELRKRTLATQSPRLRYELLRNLYRIGDVVREAVATAIARDQTPRESFPALSGDGARLHPLADLADDVEADTALQELAATPLTPDEHGAAQAILQELAGFERARFSTSLERVETDVFAEVFANALGEAP